MITAATDVFRPDEWEFDDTGTYYKQTSDLNVIVFQSFGTNSCLFFLQSTPKVPRWLYDFNQALEIEQSQLVQGSKKMFPGKTDASGPVEW